MKKYCRTGQATKDNVALAHCMLDIQVCTHSQYVILVGFHCNISCKNAPQCYVIRPCTLPVLFPTGHSSSEASASGYGYHSNEKSEKGMILKDLFELALTALAFKSFGLFILNVVLCIYAGVSNTQVIFYFTLL